MIKFCAIFVFNCSVSGEETPDIYSGGTVENFPLGPSGGNICSTPIAYAESTESLNRRPSFLDRLV